MDFDRSSPVSNPHIHNYLQGNAVLRRNVVNPVMLDEQEDNPVSFEEMMNVNIFEGINNLEDFELSGFRPALSRSAVSDKAT